MIKYHENSITELSKLPEDQLTYHLDVVSVQIFLKNQWGTPPWTMRTMLMNKIKPHEKN